MRDKISLQRAKELHPAISADVVAAIDEVEAGLPSWVAIRITQGRRKAVEQEYLFSLGRTKRNPDGYDPTKKPLGNIVTKAHWWQTLHFYGLAIDFALLIDKDRNGVFEEISWSMVKDTDADGVVDWMEMVNVFLKYGFEWGGSWRTFKDNPHLQKTYKHTWKTLYAKYQKKDFIIGSDFINLL